MREQEKTETESPRYVVSLESGNVWDAETGERLGYFTLDDGAETDPGCVRMVMAGERFDHCSVDPSVFELVTVPESVARHADNLIAAAEWWATGHSRPYTASEDRSGRTNEAEAIGQHGSNPTG